MSTYELTFGDFPVKPVRKPWQKIDWTPTMLQAVCERFPFEFSRDLAKELGVGWRILIRKARELRVEKEPDFCSKHRAEAVKKIALVRKPNPNPNQKKIL